MMFEFVEEYEEIAKIKVAGVGGAGGNAVNRMIEAGLKGVEFVAVNTDLQALRQSHAHQAIQIGCELTRGLGSGGDPRIGRKAVEEDQSAIADSLHGSDMIFITAGMGGGTGTGAAPVVARVARELGALTVGIVTKPFLFEGAVRMRQAEEGTEALRENVDTLIIIPNQRLLEVVPPDTSMREAFRIADNILYEATRGIYEIIARPNLVNLDFADVRSVMSGMGVALMGTGRATGQDRSAAAARIAISSPLLEDVDIHGAKAVLVNLTAANLGLNEVSQAMSLIQDAAGAQAHIMFGYGEDESLGDALQVTVVATGFDGTRSAARGLPIREFVPSQPPAEPRAARVAARPAPEPVLQSAPEPEPEPECEREPSRQPLAAAAVGGSAEDFEMPEPAAEPLAPFLRPLSADELAREISLLRMQADAMPEARREARAEAPCEPQPSWSDPRVEPRPEPRLEPRGELRAARLDARPEVPAESWPEPRLDRRPEIRMEAAGEIRPEPRVEPQPARRASSFRSDALLSDLNEPAYTRKYLD